MFSRAQICPGQPNTHHISTSAPATDGAKLRVTGQWLPENQGRDLRPQTPHQEDLACKAVRVYWPSNSHDRQSGARLAGFTIDYPPRQGFQHAALYVLYQPLKPRCPAFPPPHGMGPVGVAGAAQLKRLHKAGTSPHSSLSEIPMGQVPTGHLCLSHLPTSPLPRPHRANGGKGGKEREGGKKQKAMPLSRLFRIVPPPSAPKASDSRPLPSATR